ncbi:MAG: hypothetical protein HeimAB125_10780 [Candidatus Heimdallarchaeota archaeon AB_125]|nr:MAG: hypothetical protein HeimAB125_10780 [Candidatus Heimdallarchaeota archaeon AB_125]
MTSPNLDSEEEEIEILIEELEDDSDDFFKSTDHKKQDLDIKETNISDSYETIELVETQSEEIQEDEILKITSSQEIEEIIFDYNTTSKNKDRTKIIDKIATFLPNNVLEELLKEIAFQDSYTLCRAKAVSLLGDKADTPEIKRLLIQKLDDSSPKVRLWTVWSLRTIVYDPEVYEALIKKIKYFEKSKRVNLWIIRSLSDQIDDKTIQDTFIHLLKQKPDNETRKLLLFYLLQKSNDEDMATELSFYMLKEVNREIRKEIVKKLVLLDFEDVRYSLEKLYKKERDEEIKDLIYPTS